MCLRVQGGSLGLYPMDSVFAAGAKKIDKLGFENTTAVPVLSELATFFLRMYTWTRKSVWNCFWFIDFF